MLYLLNNQWLFVFFDNSIINLNNPIVRFAVTVVLQLIKLNRTQKMLIYCFYNIERWPKDSCQIFAKQFDCDKIIENTFHDIFIYLNFYYFQIIELDIKCVAYLQGVDLPFVKFYYYFEGRKEVKLKNWLIYWEIS